MWAPLERAASIASSAVGAAAAIRDAFRAEPLPKGGALLGEVGRPTTSGINTAWREPLGDLKPLDLAILLRDAINGNADAYLRLCEELEEREPHYRSVLSTRKLAVAGIRIDIDCPTDDAHDKAIAADVEELLQRPEAEALVTDMLDGLAKGFSCVEIIWSKDVNRWEPIRYEWRTQRHFLFDQETISIPRLRTKENTLEGEALQPFKWIVHIPKLASGTPLRSGLAMPVSVCYMAKRYTTADWLTFLDVFGIPVRVGKFPASMQSRKYELLQAVARIGTDAAAVIPEEMEIEILEAKGSAAGTMFRDTVEYWDKQTSKVVLGQTMSSDDGSSLAQSKTHERVRFDIRDADARAVAATLTKQLIIPFVQLNYGEQKLYPKASFKLREPEDALKLAQTVAVAVDIGAKIQASEFRDRIGFSEPDDASDLLTPAALLLAKASATDPDIQKAAANAAAAKGAKAPDDSKPPPVDVRGPKQPSRVARDDSRKSLLRFVELLSAEPKSDDVVDIATEEALEHWEQLIDPVASVLLEKLQAATSFEEATTILQTLAEDAGVELDIATFVDALARSDFKLRGVGSATDKTVLP